MKSKEVIRMLQELDPDGETEVCVGNIDIHYIEHLPAYYDGALQVLQRDENKKGYNIIGAKYCRKGNKLCIVPLSISDAITDRDDYFNIDYSELDDDRRIQLEKQHNDLRDWSKNLEEEMDREYFVQWAFKEANKLTVDLDYFKDEAKIFANKNISHGLVTKVLRGESYYSTLQNIFSTKYEIIIEDGFLKIKER